MSLADNIQKAYQGFTKTYTDEGIKTTEKYVGEKDVIFAKAESMKIGSNSSDGYGELTNINLTQNDGPFWNMDIEWMLQYDANGNKVSRSKKPTRATLTVRMQTNRLESLSNYKTCWNHWLAYRGESKSVPSWATTTSGTKVDDTQYRWLSDPSELPIEMDGDKNIWQIVLDATKPGVTGYDFPVYEMTEESTHSIKSDAAWAVAKKSGKIASPSYDDFGINAKLGGNWLCLGGSVQYDGKHWIAQCTYQHSGDSKGWDTDIYRS